MHTNPVAQENLNFNHIFLIFQFININLGVGWFLRSVGNQVTPTVELKKLGNNKYKLITSSTFKSQELEFEPGKPFDEETLDGRDVKSTMTFDGPNKLIHSVGGEPASEIVRVFGEKEMIATMKVAEVVCTRKYKVEE